MARDRVLSAPEPPSGWAPPAPARGEGPLWSAGWAPERWAPPVAPPAPAALRPRPAPEANRAALASVLLGVAGIALLALSLGFLVPLALPCSVAAWALGVSGRRRARDGRARGGHGQATAGLVLGIAGVALGVVVLVVAVALLIANAPDPLDGVPRDPGERSA